MQITRAADVGVRALAHLAMLPFGSRLTVTELAGHIDTSVPFTSRVLQRLVGARLLVSHRGHIGGFELARPSRSVSLLDIVAAIDGPLCLNACLPGGAGCDRQAWCGAHPAWGRAQRALATALASESLEAMAADTALNRGRLGLPASTASSIFTGAPANG